MTKLPDGLYDLLITRQIEDGDFIAQPPRRLAAVYQFDALRTTKPIAPEIPMSQSDLLVNARGERPRQPTRRHSVSSHQFQPPPTTTSAQ